MSKQDSEDAEVLDLSNPLDRRRFVQLTGAGAVGALAGCTGGDEETTTAPTDDDGGGGDGDGDGGGGGGQSTTSTSSDDGGGDGEPTVLRTNIGNNLSGTFYGSTNIITGSVTLHHLLYNSLTTRDPETGELRPDVVESLPEISEDGTEFTFDIREDASFQNGDDLIADDVKYSFEIMHEASLANAGSFVFENIEVEDDYRITFTTESAGTPWVDYAARYMSIIREGIHEEVDSFPEDINSGPKNGCNSGPFELVEYQPQNHAVFRAWDDYHEDGVPVVDEVRANVISESSAQNIAIRQGDTHILGQPNPKDFDSLAQRDGIQANEIPNPSARITVYLSHKPPFDDLDVRKAVSYAMPRQQVIDSVLFGHGFTSSIPAPPGTWFYNESADYYGDEVQADKVEEHLDAAGMSDGFEFDIITSSESAQSDVAILMQQALSQFGITMNIQQIDPGSFYGEIAAQNYVAGLEFWTSAINPDYYFSTLFTEFGKYEGWHQWGKYGETEETRAQITELVNESRQYVDRSERAPIYKEILQLLADDVPYIWLGGQNIMRLWRDDVQDYYVNPGDWQNLRQVDVQ